MHKEMRVLLLASALFMLAGGLFGPIYAIFVEEIGGDLLTAGGAYAAFSIAAGLLVFLISKWEDHVKHQEKLVVLGYVCSTIGFFGYLMIQTPLDLFIVQIIFGIGEAIGLPAYDGLYSRHLDKGKYASEWGVWESMNYIVTGISAIIGGYLANVFGFKFLFAVMVLISIVGLLISLLLLGKYAKRTKRSRYRASRART